MRDEDGNPAFHYPRNKIRTAKYTPLSFVPKNIWFQFHNIANIFFLVVILLVIFPTFGSVNPGLSAVPLIAIVVLTGIKDAIEDYRRTITDMELNNATVHRLMDWENVNVLVTEKSTWRETKKSVSNLTGGIWCRVQGLWSKKGRLRTTGTITEMHDEMEEPHQLAEALQTGVSMPQSPEFLEESESIHGHIEMVPVCSLPQSRNVRLQQATEEDNGAPSFATQGMKPDIINYGRAASNVRFKKDAWKNILVGDFVRVYKDDELPADIIFLSTSNPDGVCHVETKNLDGETSLKVRQALRCGRSLKHARDCGRSEFRVESEAPQPNLYQFNGAIRWKQTVPGYGRENPEDMVEAVTMDNLLLRGCHLRNTEWILGVVVYSGHDTKIMMYAGLTPSKRARLSCELNFNVVFNFGILFAVCLLCAIANGAAWGRTERSKSFFDFGSIGGSPAATGFITFLAAIINFQTLVPISLYITLESIRALQALFIYNDVEMYYEKLNQRCVPRTWNISDDVGQIEYIFSDKTGTLTQNVMKFKGATINGRLYGEFHTGARAGAQQISHIDMDTADKRVHTRNSEAKAHCIAALRSMYDNPYLRDDNLTFISPDFVADLGGKSGPEQTTANENLLLSLALCHTAIAEKTPGNLPTITYKAQSPDEEALVGAARDMGFTFLGSSGEVFDLNVWGEERQYRMLTTISFSSARKRMSSILQIPDGRIILFCKGADSVVYSRLKRNDRLGLRQKTAEHLKMFAQEGLRTFCIAYKELSEHSYRQWKSAYDLAAADLHHRDEKLEAAAELIEQDLLLLGGTTIEDRLQDGVPDTIARLVQAGIKLWVLTGDKVETAINIGYSCNLLRSSMELIHLTEDEGMCSDTSDDKLLDDLERMIERCLAKFNLSGSYAELKTAKNDHKTPDPTHGLVIDGPTLQHALHDRLRLKFLLLCKQCRAVLCCRASPAQKASVVAMVKNGLNAMTLAVGDGANDVAMIQQADIGVGIAGLEGRQATMASDYAIGQFRYLQRLVLVHGRWSYRRLAESISNPFYKNTVWAFSMFWFQFYCEMDITYLFEYSYIVMFNLLFTSLPVAVLGVLDQDVSDAISLAVPELYRVGVGGVAWTQRKFWLYMLDGVYQSVVVFYIPYLLFSHARPVAFCGLAVDDRYRLGAYVAHPAVCTINAYVMLNSYRWDWLMLLIIAISDLSVFLWTGVYTSFTFSDTFYRAALQIYGEASFWACFFIVPVLCLLPRFTIKAFNRLYYPSDIDVTREQASMAALAISKTQVAKLKVTIPSFNNLAEVPSSQHT